MKIRRIAGSVAVLAAGALVLAGCGGGSGSGTSGGGQTGVVTVNGSEPENPLIPTNTNETGGGKIIDLINSGLFYYDADGIPQPEIAASVTSDDKIVWTVALDDGWVFSDGSPITAHSFVDAWNFGALSSNNQLNGYWFQDIEGFDALQAETQDGQVIAPPEKTEMSGLVVLDDLTFTITLTSALADYPLRLGYAAYYPLPEAAFDDVDAYGRAPLSSGPYTIAENGWRHNQEIRLIPNDMYSGGRTPMNKGVTVKFYTGLDAAYNDLLSGNLDVLDSIPPSSFATFENELGMRAVNQPAAIFQSFTIPQWLDHFTGAEGALRRAAISHAIDRETITSTIFSGTRTPAVDFTSPVIDGWSDSIEGSDVLTYDPAKAVELWAQADAVSRWTGTFTIAYNADGGHQEWVDAVTNSIRNVLGIEAVAQSYGDFATMRTDVNAARNGAPSGLTGAWRSGWQADYPGLYNFLGALYGTGGSSNDGNYSDPAFDALLLQGNQAATLDEANGFFQESQTILFKDLPAIPLWYSNVTGGFSTSVDGVVFGWNSVPLYWDITKK
ncbi:MAG: ABC transporter substrate-binding protein [Micrococcales bacterium]|nr:ABC transporter substrate-binding protein [Micrococcales bacterium]